MIYPLIMTICICLTFTIHGCTHDEKYQNITLTLRSITFNFEYPVTYEDTYNYLKGHHAQLTNMSEIILLRNVIEYPSFQADTRFSVEIEKTGEYYVDAFDKCETILKGPGSHDFKLLERSQIKIAGIQSELIIYTQNHTDESPLGSSMVITRAAYFDYKDNIWLIMLNAHTDRSEEAKAELDRIIGSFKFIE